MPFPKIVILARGGTHGDFLHQCCTLMNNNSTVSINDKGKVLMDDDPTKIDEIKKFALKKIANNPKIIFSVLTNKNTQYSDYILVLDQLKQANATKISIANPPGF